MENIHRLLELADKHLQIIAEEVRSEFFSRRFSEISEKSKGRQVATLVAETVFRPKPLIESCDLESFAVEIKARMMSRERFKAVKYLYDRLKPQIPGINFHTEIRIEPKPPQSMALVPYKKPTKEYELSENDNRLLRSLRIEREETQKDVE